MQTVQFETNDDCMRLRFGGRFVLSLVVSEYSSTVYLFNVGFSSDLNGFSEILQSEEFLISIRYQNMSLKIIKKIYLKNKKLSIWMVIGNQAQIQ